MRASWRSIFTAVFLGASIMAATISACSSGGERPGVGGLSDTNPRLEAGSASDASNEAEASVEPDSCKNAVKDGNETDIDCGGNQCSKCIDGKTCIATTDCAGGGCLNGKCVTPACTNNTKDGDETDNDCGGSLCLARCTYGKRCVNSADCVTASCVMSKCACPAGMVEAVRQGAATAYCIDATEVTKAQYQKFYIASDVNSQDPVCKAAGKQSFSPRDAWSPQDVPGGLAFNLSLPVHYVDWCDAYAYCKWAGKQLCGSVTGGTVAPAQADTASAGAWYNACSKGGASTHPYGDTPVEGKCNSGQDPDAGAGSSATCGSQAQSRSGYGCAQNRDEGIHEVVNGDIGGGYTEILFRGCAGGMLGLYHMTGNVAEWENSCDSDQTDANCRVRGGSYKSGSESALRCDDGRTVKRVPPDTPEGNASLADVGIRCCLF